MTTLLVNASKHEGVMVLELSNRPANTYSYQMTRELDAHILDARMDESVHVLMLTGARRPADAKKPHRVLLRRSRHRDAPEERAALQGRRGTVTIASAMGA
jgi:enoyl-CoA hydratase/carnithine racemase